MLDDAVDFSATPTMAFCYVKGTGITDAGKDEAMTYGGQGGLVQCQPGDGADGSGNPKEAIGITKGGDPGQTLGQLCGDDHARKVVIAKRRMAGVGRDQNLVVFRLDSEFAIGQMAGFRLESMQTSYSSSARFSN